MLKAVGAGDSFGAAEELMGVTDCPDGREAKP
jgi:hypothetical protein